MQKTYVLDANVLLQAPYALESFEDNHIVLPLAVLEELDALKGADGEAGNNARQALRFLEDLRLRGDLVKSVTLPSGGTVRLEVNHVDAALPQGIEPGSWAGRVLKVCRGLMDEGTPVTLVSRDMVARIRAQMMGVPAEDFTTDRLPDGAQPYTGRAEVYIPDDLLPAFKKKGAPAERALYRGRRGGAEAGFLDRESVRPSALGYRAEKDHAGPLPGGEGDRPALWRRPPIRRQAPERGPAIYAGGPAAAGGGGAPGHHPGAGGHRQDLLRPGRRAGAGAGGGGAALPQDFGVPPQRPV